jgi:hypothetical protein
MRRRTIATMIAAALVTFGAASLGLHLALWLWRALPRSSGCEVAPAAAPPQPALAAPAPASTKKRIFALSLDGGAVEIEAGGARHRLRGYPPPLSRNHRAPRITTAVVAPDGRQVAIAGVCFGSSGTDQLVPSCAPRFVRLYAAGGARVRDLALPWEREIDDEGRLLAMAFDERAERLAVLVRALWSDCSFEGARVELVVYRLSDGARLEDRVVTYEDTGGRRSLAFIRGRVVVIDARAPDLR